MARITREVRLGIAPPRVALGDGSVRPMAARTPRRSFATPFVVTLAAAPACYVQSGPPPQQPTPTTTATSTTGTQPDPSTQPAQPTGQQPPPVMVNPPRPQATTPNAKWRIYADASGKCFSQPIATCPPNVMCNPPPPQAYECPTKIDLKAGAQTIVSSADGMSCSVDWGPMNCPAGATCNPPPPVSVSCPRP